MPSFGEELRRERELRAITLREVAEATKVNIRYLEAMERNDFEHLPGGVFNRGFVRAYAQFIGVDPDAMVNAYLLQERNGDTHGDDDAAPLLRGRREVDPAPTPRRPEAKRRPSKLVRWGLVALLLIAIAAAAAVAVHLISDRPGTGPVAAGEPHRD